MPPHRRPPGVVQATIPQERSEGNGLLKSSLTMFGEACRLSSKRRIARFMGTRVVTAGPRNVQFQRELDQQIGRLREMLVLMAPETGASALGATVNARTIAPSPPRVQLAGVRRIPPPAA
jgi:hypothetical protein